MIAKCILVKGIVQGVGFRPFVYRIAKEDKLKGYVSNNSNGVIIYIQGTFEGIEKFMDDLKKKAPALSRIDEIYIENVNAEKYNTFNIISSSEDNSVSTLISPDIATCDECMNEVINGYKNRRFLYPFTNCTNCGPRFSIIKKLPYDRENTTMKAFPMCTECYEEYTDPLNRRFHAEPTCCNICGPEIYLIRSDGKEIYEENVMEITRKLLKEEKIIAVKGIGGFNLVCSGESGKIIDELRRRKNRPNKPLAVMMKDIDTVKRYCNLSKYEEDLLSGNRKPIVLLTKRNKKLPYNIAYDNNRIGVILPYSPLHQLLFKDNLNVLVFTSGNNSGAPIVFDNDEAINELGNIADYFLMHNRNIYMSIDDSVVKENDNKTYMIRGGRGFYPMYFDYKTDNTIFACGSNMKNTFAISFKDKIYLSPYIGDLDFVEVQERFLNQVNHIKAIYGIDEKYVACDMHPNYWSNEFGKSQKKKEIKVYHHHAHIVSCMFENKVKGDVIGVAYDGIGLGENGEIWGGEFLICNYSKFKRVGTINNVVMPGGDGATKNPWFMGVSLAYSALNGNKAKMDEYLPSFCSKNEYKLIMALLKGTNNYPLCSSMGRFFDGIASFLGFEKKVSYEGEAAIYLENLANSFSGTCINNQYEFNVIKAGEILLLDFKETILQVLIDIKNRVSRNEIAWKFHNTIIFATVKMCILLRNKYNLNIVVLSGGVLQNTILLRGIRKELKQEKFLVKTHNLVPCNDGGVSLGQVIIADSLIKG